MINVNAKFVLTYFDRNIIKKKWGRMNKDPLEHASNQVMRIARNSIRNQGARHKGVKAKKPSKPGRPPYSWAPGKPFKMIFADWLGISFTSRIVGMVGFGEQPPVPGLHEHGGWARRSVLVKSPRRRKNGTYASPKMVRKVMMVHYPKRPFMLPALLKSKSRYPKLWQNAFNRAA